MTARKPKPDQQPDQPEPPEAGPSIIVKRDEVFPLADLQPYHKNPRRGDVPLIRASLREHGQYRDLIVNLGALTGRANEILAGNHTYAGMLAEGWETGAVSFVDVDDQKAAKIVVVDNRSSDKARNDADVLADLLGDLDSLEGTGYSDEELAKMLGSGDESLDEVFATRFELVVECADEGEQAELYERLAGEGLSVRVLSM